MSFGNEAYSLFKRLWEERNPKAAAGFGKDNFSRSSGTPPCLWQGVTNETRQTATMREPVVSSRRHHNWCGLKREMSTLALCISAA